MLDLRGAVLEQDEREILAHPQTGGVILFARNYQDPDQLRELTRRIREVRQPPLLIAVDHEGGRVQRFRDQFTRIPPGRAFGRCYDRDRKDALDMAAKAGWVLASELLSVGVDFSFTPVLDLDAGMCPVIGDRAFHNDVDAITALADACVKGMKSAGMAAVGKHFPGHGHVREDSHVAVPVDERPYADIMMKDLVPFERLVSHGIAAIMPAHVIYPRVDDKPAGFSRIWLDEILRGRLGFTGMIFSDDIDMAGAGVAGDYPARAAAALDAGCDMVLVCNNQPMAAAVLDGLPREARPVSRVRMMRMYGNGAHASLAELKQDGAWRDASAAVAAMDRTPELDLDDDEIRS